MWIFAVHLCLLPKGISWLNSTLTHPVAARANLLQHEPALYIRTTSSLKQHIAEFVNSSFTLKNSLGFGVCLSFNPIIRLQDMLQQYEQLVQSLERVVQPEEGLHPALRSQEGHEPPLKIILQNLYRYLMAVTANLDKLHEGVADARQAFLDKRKQVGACVCTLACTRPSFCPRCLLSLG